MTEAAAQAPSFYPMREVSRLTAVPPYTLRYWESKFNLLRPTRLQGGQRKYTKTDLEMILRIKDLLVRQRMTLAGAKRALASHARARSLEKPAAGLDLPAASLVREVRQELDVILDEMDRLTRQNG